MPENATANEVLDECKDEFEQLLVIGWSEEGLMSAKSTASLDIKEIIYMIEVFKSVIITTGHEVE
jgi:quinol monooxygenase YgiN